jgi:hypothetical protein
MNTTHIPSRRSPAPARTVALFIRHAGSDQPILSGNPYAFRRLRRKLISLQDGDLGRTWSSAVLHSVIGVPLLRRGRHLVWRSCGEGQPGPSEGIARAWLEHRHGRWFCSGWLSYLPGSPPTGWQGPR